MKKGLITLVVVGYNRPDSIRRILGSLERADYDYEDIRLVVSIDHSGMEEVVRTAEECAGPMARRRSFIGRSGWDFGSTSYPVAT
ncbi:MAG: hypothetical protein V8S36_08510 [Lachnospiraceae bacterium]